MKDIVDTARFVNKSRDAAEFDAFVKRFDLNYSPHRGE